MEASWAIVPATCSILTNIHLSDSLSDSSITSVHAHTDSSIVCSHCGKQPQDLVCQPGVVLLTWTECCAIAFPGTELPE
jgi:hypothetical protein